MLKTSIVILEILAKGPFFTIEPHLDKNIDFLKARIFTSFFLNLGLKIFYGLYPYILSEKRFKKILVNFNA